jgi:hypothetical protein
MPIRLLVIATTVSLNRSIRCLPYPYDAARRTRVARGVAALADSCRMISRRHHNQLDLGGGRSVASDPRRAGTDFGRLLIAEKTFRRLDAPELLADLARGEIYVDGVRAVNRRDTRAARHRFW